MIASVKGIVEIIDSSYTIIDVNGVGYKIIVPNTVLSKIKTGEVAKLYTHTNVREDILDLYGFSNLVDLKLFELLISVSGVGPKTALGIFSIGSSDEITKAITTADVGFFTLAPRLGKKNAQKIIIELKGKIGSTGSLDLTGNGKTQSTEIIDALRSFGFTTSEIQKALHNIKKQDATTEEKIRLALKELGK